VSRFLLRRELALAFGARVTWVVAALSALLVGHGFVLAIDLYAAASASALSNILMRRELDPLSGIVRPTLGGLHLAMTILVPLIAARGLALEKERNSYGSLALQAGSTERVVLHKWLAALVAAALPVLPAGLLVCAYALAGGHLGLLETALAFAGHLAFVAVVASASVAAAAGSDSFAQAATLGILLSLASWALDASAGFGALAWMSALESLSLERLLAPFEHGVLSLASSGALLILIVWLTGLALQLGRFQLRTRRAAVLVGSGLLAVPALFALGHVQRGYDLTESSRMSLPTSVVDALRKNELPIRIEVWLERDDGRRAHIERDVLAKLKLAQPAIEIVMPLDAEPRLLAARAQEYGRIVVHAGDELRETRSTSRKEITTVLFEALDKPLPPWSQSAYPGYPWVASPAARNVLAVLAYALIPGALLVTGWFSTRTRRRT
jgi:ABC-2 type transport system permease protein